MYANIDDVKRDLELLYSLGVDKKVRQILVRRMEHTSTSQPRLKELSSRCIEHYEECISWIKINYPDVIYTVPILKDVFRGGNNEYFIDADKRIATITAIISEHSKDKFINLICPLSGYDYFTDAFKDYLNVRTNLIQNNLYGGSVSVAGLLNHQDIRSQFQPQKNDLMIMPNEMYNADGLDPLGEPMSALSEYYQSKIILA